MEHDYITLKLVNGDNLLAVMIDNDDEAFYIMFPLQVKTVNVKTDEKTKEVMAATRWCPFSDQEYYPIYKSDVLLIAPMNDVSIEYYKNLIDIDQLDHSSSSDDEPIESLFTSSTIH